jgi:hypothetical protein
MFAAVEELVGVTVAVCPAPPPTYPVAPGAMYHRSTVYLAPPESKLNCDSCVYAFPNDSDNVYVNVLPDEASAHASTTKPLPEALVFFEAVCRFDPLSTLPELVPTCPTEMVMVYIVQLDNWILAMGCRLSY